jgi:hypothetical protein
MKTELYEVIVCARGGITVRTGRNAMSPDLAVDIVWREVYSDEAIISMDGFTVRFNPRSVDVIMARVTGTVEA